MTPLETTGQQINDLVQELRHILANAPSSQIQACALADVVALLVSLIPEPDRDQALTLWIGMVKRLVEGYDASRQRQHHSYQRRKTNHVH